jgi:hypothetical protein
MFHEYIMADKPNWLIKRSNLIIFTKWVQFWDMYPLADKLSNLFDAKMTDFCQAVLLPIEIELEVSQESHDLLNGVIGGEIGNKLHYTDGKNPLGHWLTSGR